MLRIPIIPALSSVVLAGALGGCSDYDVAHVRGSDVFFQGGDDAEADVLFVLDDSPSMGEEQDRLSENFSAFVDVLAESYADYRIGITTTDADLDGALLGEVLTPDTTDLEASFLEQVDVGATGDRDEQGLEVARLALATGTDTSLRRDGARLNVVVFSDEDDHSPDTVSAYVNQLSTVAGDSGFHFHAVVGDLPAGCASGSSAADPGTRYAEAVAQTEGYIDSICAEDYTPMLTRVGLDVAGLNDIFFLTKLPRPDTLEAWVDGVRIPEREVDGWQYSSGDNAVVFSGRAIPRPGMQVKLAYEIQAGTAADTGG